MTLATPSTGVTRHAKPYANTQRPRKASKTPLILAAIAVAGALSLGTGGYFYMRTPPQATVVTYNVAPINIDVKVKLSGELKATRNEEVRSAVEGVTTILTIVPEGTRVKEGDLLVTLSSDEIQTRIDDSRIRVENAKAAAETADEALKIQDMQNDSDMKAAEMNAEVARLEYAKFIKGDALTQLETLTTNITNAETDLTRKTDDQTQTNELAAKGFVSGNDVLNAKIAFLDAQTKLKAANMAMEVWNKYDQPKQTQTLLRKQEETQREIERCKLRIAANRRTKETDLRAKQSTAKLEETRLAYLIAQKEACTIKAPSGGMVVYQSSLGGGYGNNNGPIEEGAQVRQNQILIQLPETSQMMVEVKIAEQMLDRVQEGQIATVTVDAWPGKYMSGKVKSISVLADSSNRWANPLLKEYPTQITLDGEYKNLKPGMTARVEIQIAQLEQVVGVPLQALYTNAGQAYVFVGTESAYEKRTVTTGLSSADMMQITDGLKPGETVLLSRPKDAPEDQPARRPRDNKSDAKPDATPATPMPAAAPPAAAVPAAASPSTPAPAGKQG